MKNITKVMNKEEFIFADKKASLYQFYKRLKRGEADKVAVSALVWLLLMIVAAVFLFTMGLQNRKFYYFTWAALSLCIGILWILKIKKGAYDRQISLYDEYKQNAEDITYEFLNDHIQIEQENREKKYIKYCNIQKIKEIKTGYLLFYGNNTLFVSKKGFLGVAEKEYTHFMKNLICNRIRSK